MPLRIRVLSEAPYKSRVILSGELDLATVPDFRAALEDVVQERTGDVVLDLSELRYLGSVGVSAMIKAMDELEAHGRKLMLTGAHDSAELALQMLGLAHLLDQTTPPHRRMSADGSADCNQG